MGKKEFRNFGDLTDLNKNLDEICRMCWFDDDENKVSVRCSEILTEFIPTQLSLSDVVILLWNSYFGGCRRKTGVPKETLSRHRRE